MSIKSKCIIPHFYKGNNATSKSVNSEFSNKWTKPSDTDTAIVMKYEFNYKHTEGKQIQLR